MYILRVRYDTIYKNVKCPRNAGSLISFSNERIETSFAMFAYLHYMALEPQISYAWS